MNARAQTSSLWRVLTTPIGPHILPRFVRGPDSRQVIAAANLPDTIADLVSATARRTRLRAREQADVAAELCSHFAEGLAAGRSAEELTGTFGDARTAAALIRRAKIRGRPLLWHITRRTLQALLLAVALVLLIYAWLAYRYFTGKPTIARNYMAELNAPTLAIPESDRAWPLYRDALVARVRGDGALQGAWGPFWPEDAVWPALVERVRNNDAAIALIRRAARPPSLGALLTDAEDPQIRAHLGYETPAAPPGENPPLMRMNSQALVSIQQLANLLVHHACVACEDGDAAGVVADISDMVAIARHPRQLPILAGDVAGLAIDNAALDTIDDVLLRRPDLFSDADLVRLAHRLAPVGDRSASALHWDKERAFVHDFLQRYYTDDGHGSGFLTPEGHAFVTDSMALPALAEPNRLLEPLRVASAFPSRKEARDSCDRTIEQAREEAAAPLYARPGAELRDPIFDFAFSERLGRVYISMPFLPAMFSSGLRAVGLVTSKVAQHRDATLTRIALELHKRRHGAYPASLSELVPHLLPAVPIDRYDGGVLKYTLQAGRPVLYAVGTDRNDDGGRPPPGELGNFHASRWLSPAAISALMTNPTLARMYDGDWVLWPPLRQDPFTKPAAPPP